MKTTQEVDSFLNKMLIGTTATFLAGAAFLGANVERESVGQCPDELAGELAFCIDGVGHVEMEPEEFLAGMVTLGAGFLAVPTCLWKRELEGKQQDTKE